MHYIKIYYFIKYIYIILIYFLFDSVQTSWMMDLVDGDQLKPPNKKNTTIAQKIYILVRVLFLFDDIFICFTPILLVKENDKNCVLIIVTRLFKEPNIGVL